MIMNLHIWNFFAESRLSSSFQLIIIIALSTQCPIGDMYVI